MGNCKYVRKTIIRVCVSKNLWSFFCVVKIVKVIMSSLCISTARDTAPGLQFFHLCLEDVRAQRSRSSRLFLPPPSRRLHGPHLLRLVRIVLLSPSKQSGPVIQARSPKALRPTHTRIATSSFAAASAPMLQSRCLVRPTQWCR